LVDEEWVQDIAKADGNYVYVDTEKKASIRLVIEGESKWVKIPWWMSVNDEDAELFPVLGVTLQELVNNLRPDRSWMIGGTFQTPAADPKEVSRQKSDLAASRFKAPTLFGDVVEVDDDPNNDRYRRLKGNLLESLTKAKEINSRLSSSG
jgi:hypothetical protein